LKLLLSLYCAKYSNRGDDAADTAEPGEESQALVTRTPRECPLQHKLSSGWQHPDEARWHHDFDRPCKLLEGTSGLLAGIILFYKEKSA
jgi:hypothetical protein